MSVALTIYAKRIAENYGNKFCLVKKIYYLCIENDNGSVTP